EYGDDGDHHQQLDQREAAPLPRFEEPRHRCTPPSWNPRLTVDNPWASGLVLPKTRVPDLDLAPARVAAGRGQMLPVRAEGHAPDVAGMAAQGADLRAVGHVPDLHRRVPACGSQVPTVGAEGHPPDIALVAAEGADFLARRRVPELDGLILAGRGDELVIRADGYERAGVGKMPDHPNRLLCIDVPDLDGR